MISFINLPYINRKGTLDPFPRTLTLTGGSWGSPDLIRDPHAMPPGQLGWPHDEFGRGALLSEGGKATWWLRGLPAVTEKNNHDDNDHSNNNNNKRNNNN